MQTVRDYIKEAIRFTLLKLDESILKQEAIYKQFIERNNVRQKQLNKDISLNPGVPKERIKYDIPVPTSTEMIVLMQIEKHTHISMYQILGRSRYRETVDARKMYMVILFFYLNYNLPKAGIRTGRDHSTVIHAIKSHENLMLTNAHYMKVFSKILSDLGEILPDYFIQVETTDLRAFQKNVQKQKWDELLSFQKDKINLAKQNKKDKKLQNAETY